MNFAERNEAWQGPRRVFQQPHSRSGVNRVWTVEVAGPVIKTSWGQLGGAMQTAEETHNGVNHGKTNAKDGATYALERAREMARKKVWEGYREVNYACEFMDPPVKAEVDFNNLPMSLSFYKPDNSMGSGIEKKARAGKCWYTRKRNGMMKVLVKDSFGELKIYSRRMLRQHDLEQETEYTWDDRFPHLISAIEPHIPPNTILLGELVVEENGKERFDLAQSAIKNLTPKAVKEMGETGLYPFFYCWDIAFWDGENLVGHKTMHERFDKIVQLTRAIDLTKQPMKVFEPLHVCNFKTPEEAVEFAKKEGWEGFVVIDPHAVYGDKAFNFKGKPDRPGSACAKLKPAFEDDFIAIWNPEKGFGERSTKGSRAGGIKSVGLYQKNASGQLVFISNVSSGLTKELLLSQADTRLWPQVWQVEYTGRRYIFDGDDSNALDFPRYIATRTDKTPEECFNPKL